MSSSILAALSSALCVFTGLSFVFNELARHEVISHMGSVAAIVIVAIMNATPSIKTIRS